MRKTCVTSCTWQIREALRKCVRIDPRHGDFGGFFCALFEKLTPGPATRPARLGHEMFEVGRVARPTINWREMMIGEL